MCICHPKLLNVIFLFIVFVLLFFFTQDEKNTQTTFYLFYFGDFCMYFSYRKIKQLWLIYVVSLYVRILPPKILGVIFYFFVFILLFFCLYSSWQKQRYKIVVTGLNACTGPVPVTTNATFLTELQQGQKLPGPIARLYLYSIVYPLYFLMNIWKQI